MFSSVKREPVNVTMRKVKELNPQELPGSVFKTDLLTVAPPSVMPEGIFILYHKLVAGEMLNQLNDSPDNDTSQPNTHQESENPYQEETDAKAGNKSLTIATPAVTHSGPLIRS